MDTDNDINDDYYQQHLINVDRGQEPLRIDKFLMNRLERVTRNKVQTAIKAGSVLVNDKEVKPNHRVKPYDVVQVIMPKETEGVAKVMPEDIPLEIVFEDEYLMVINKPAGMVVHPGYGNKNGTLVNAIAYHLQRDDIPVLPGNNIDRPGLVHRLDKDTTGLMVIAKTEYAMSHLAKQFFDRDIDRRYWALVWGNFDEESGTVDEYISRHPRKRMVMAVFEDGSEGKHARTHYKVMEDMYYVSLVECKLDTGRTHQIRVHMQHLRHPVFADTMYGGDQIVKGTIYSKYKKFVENCFQLCGRQALHAKSLGFVHPMTGEKLFFDSTLPSDMNDVIEKWRAYFTTKSE